MPAGAVPPAAGLPPEVGRPPLARSVHDRAAIHRDDDGWLGQAWRRARVLPVSSDSRVPVRRSPSGVEPEWAAAEDFETMHPRLLLGEHDGIAYFAIPTAAPAPDDGWAGLRDIGGAVDELAAGLLTSAIALVQWHANHPRCPRCGSVTAVVSAGWSRRCPVDESLHFPRTDPAVIMLVHDGGDRCVMGRQASWPVGRFSVLAGFVEAGESAEGAVAREVFEEVGLYITDIRYVASQPWPFPQSLMLGYLARVDGPETLTRHDGELAEADWFSKADLRAAAVWSDEPAGSVDPLQPEPRLAALPGGISIARQLVELWLAG